MRRRLLHHLSQLINEEARETGRVLFITGLRVSHRTRRSSTAGRLGWVPVTKVIRWESIISDGEPRGAAEFPEDLNFNTRGDIYLR